MTLQVRLRHRRAELRNRRHAGWRVTQCGARSAIPYPPLYAIALGLAANATAFVIRFVVTSTLLSMHTLTVLITIVK